MRLKKSMREAGKKEVKSRKNMRKKKESETEKKER